ncbi:MAG: class I SAM-dependent RNA methyltransferase [Candidatus Omnitrophica bacterium]|nr:class I SAM-dependent RNA methyltransferase [Candidatus Omnitrophota bacterium]
MPDVNSDYKQKIEPVCPIFGECGGCQYQDISYEDELALKRQALKALLEEKVSLPESCFEPVVRSPKQYHYRSRMDLKLLKTRQQEVFVGFSPVAHYPVIEAQTCAIAMDSIADFFPELKKQAIEKLPAKYRIASLVVKTGDDGRVFWGGIGRRSLRMSEQDYLWTEVRGRRVFYSLETFFQANLSILPALMDHIEALGILDQDTCFFDLYGGVGLFGLCLYDCVGKVLLIEENVHAIKVAKHNIAYHDFKNFDIVSGRVEDHLPFLLDSLEDKRSVVMIDPPRRGLSPAAAAFLADLSGVEHLLYLSCNPEALARDLSVFVEKGWSVMKVIPFDFFPRTKHLETLVVLRNNMRRKA